MGLICRCDQAIRSSIVLVGQYGTYAHSPSVRDAQGQAAESVVMPEAINTASGDPLPPLAPLAPLAPLPPGQRCVILGVATAA